MCIEDCKNEKNYRYEYENKCYSSCPKGTEISQNNECISSDIKTCPEDFPYLLVETNECVKKCKIADLFSGTCSTDNPNENTKEENINNIKKGIEEHSIDDLLDNIVKEKGEDLIISEKDIKYTITSTANQDNNKNNNISTIKLGKCENILKNKYNISINDSLLILKLDIFKEGMLTPIIEYEVYHPETKDKLNLEYCKNTPININLPIPLNETDLFKYDPKNEYYTDLCNTYTTENGTDITLTDRQNEYINNNLSLCENECKYNGYDNRKQKISCECLIKIKLPIISEIKIDKNKIKESFTDIKNIINLNILKCYKTLFKKEGLIFNIGNYIILSVIFFYLISSFIFFSKGYGILVDKINNILNFNFSKNYNKKETKIINRLKTEENPNISKNIRINKHKMRSNKFNKNKKKYKVNVNKKIKNRKEGEPPKKIKVLQSSSNIKNNNKSYNKSFLDSNKLINNLELNNTTLINNIKNIKKIDKKININKPKIILNFNDYELNTLLYEEALLYDKRTYFQYYWSLLKTKHLLLFTIIPSNDYNSRIIKFCLFIFSFSQYYAVNALFFTEKIFHSIYKDGRSYNFILIAKHYLFLFNFFYF